MSEIQSNDQRFLAIKKTLTLAKPNIEEALADRLGDRGPDLFVRTMLNSLAANPFLQTCTPRSLVAAALESAGMGLQIDGVLGHAYVVPFRNNKENCWEAKFIPGYKGYLALAAAAGCPVWAHVVYEKDEFNINLGSNTLSHEVRDWNDRGEPIGAYAAARVNGQFVYEFVPRSEIERVKKRALDQAKGRAKYAAWSTDEMAMWRKTPVRRLFKFLPLPPMVQRMAEEDEQNDMKPREPEYEEVGPVDTEAQAEAADIVKELDNPSSSSSAASSEEPKQEAAEEFWEADAAQADPG